MLTEKMIDDAAKLLEVYFERKKIYDEVNEKLEKVNEFSTQINMIDEHFSAALIGYLETVFDCPDLIGHMVFENEVPVRCDCIECGDRFWEMNTPDEFRALMKHYIMPESYALGERAKESGEQVLIKTYSEYSRVIYDVVTYDKHNRADLWVADDGAFYRTDQIERFFAMPETKSAGMENAA